MATALMGHSAFKAESMELYSLSILKLLGSRVGKVGCPTVQLKELRLKGSGVPMRGVESNRKPGPQD